MKKSILSLFTMSLVIASCSKNDDAVVTPPAPVAPTATTITIADASRNFPVSGTINETPFATGVATIPTTGANKTFDYSGLVLGTPFSYAGGNVANTAFATATSSQNVFTTFIGSTQTAAGVTYYKTNTADFSLLGIKYNTDTVLNYPGVGTVNFLAQNVLNIPAQKIAEFPMTYNQSTSQVVRATTNFTVDSPALPAPNLPAKYEDVKTITTSNIAWGTVKIPGYANAMNTLVQKTTESVVRNYFLINATGGYDPMPAQLLQAVGIVDGATTVFTDYKFWVAGKGFVLRINANGSGSIYNGM